MTEPADPDNANVSSFGHVCPNDPAVDANPCAHQGCRDLELHVTGELDNKASISNMHSLDMPEEVQGFLTYATIYSAQPPSTVRPFIRGLSQ